MITSEEFLTRIVPPGGHYVIGLKRAEGIGHRYLTDPAAAAAFAERASADGHTVYHACASFGPKDGGRRATNALAAGALWLDIDCGDGKPYPSKRAGLTALGEYLTASGMPQPMVVDSGNGLHVYWPLDRALPRDEWVALAQALKDNTHQHGLAADRTRTADIASILRPVGTVNRKHGGERPVRAVMLNKDRLSVERAIELLGALPAPEIAYAAGMNSDLSAGLSSGTTAPPLADDVAAGCAQLAAMRDSQGVMDYPSWYACLGVLAYCEDGDQKAHEWSAGDTRYKPSQVDKFLADWRKLDGGSTCSKFWTADPAKCAACPSKDRIRSPLAIGRRVEVQQTVTQPDGTFVTKVISKAPDPDMPFGFVKLADGIGRRVKAEDGTLTDILICRTIFRPVRVINNSPDPNISIGYEIEFEAEYHTPSNQKTILRNFLLPSKVVGGPTGEFMTSLSSHMIYAEPNDAAKRSLQEYALRYIDILKKRQDETITCNHYGWHDEGFLVGRDMITPTGPRKATLTGNAADKIGAFGSGHGDVVAWADAVNKAVGQRGYEMYQFALLSSLAAPLYGFNPDTPAVFTYYYSTASGVGKTTAHKIGLSAWGDPDKLILSGNAVTLNSFFALLGVYANLPVVYDELTSQRVMEPGQLVFWLSHGTPKERLGTDGRLRNNNASWQTIAFGSGNNSLSNKIIGTRGDTTGERARLFEIPAAPVPPLDDARELFAEIFKHAGAAAPLYVERLVSLRASLPAAVMGARAQVERRFKMAQDERFWASLFGSVLVAHQIGTQLGLVRFPLAPVVLWMRDMLAWNRASMTRARGDTRDAFASMMADLLPSTLVTEGVDPKSRKAFVIAKPHGKLAARTILARSGTDRTLFYVAAADVAEWCRKKDVSVEDLKRTLEQDKVFLKSEKANLAAFVPEVPSMQTRCWILDISNSDAAGSVLDEFVQRLKVVSNG